MASSLLSSQRGQSRSDWLPGIPNIDMTLNVDIRRGRVSQSVMPLASKIRAS
jgi:hypothetical protein